MSKRKVLNYTRRMLAFLIAMIMTFSVVESAALTTYASTGSDIVVEEAEFTETVEEIETTVSDTGEALEPSVEDASGEEPLEPIFTEFSSE